MASKPTILQTVADIPSSLITPDESDTRLGKLTHVDGAPSNDTIQKVLDNLDFVRALSIAMVLGSHLPGHHNI